VTFQFMQNLGVLLSARSKAKEAEELLRAALEGRRKIVGEDHPDTLASKESLGVMLAGRGKLREGEELLRAVLEARRRLLGGDHASTIQITSQLASLLEMKNERAAAESLLSEAYASIQRTKSYARPEAAWIVSQLVELLQKRGELAAAERIATETLAAQRQSELAPSVSTIRTMTSLGLILHQQGKLGEAEVELRAVLPLLRKRDGDQGSTTQMVAMVLASILVKSSRCPEAVDLLESFETPALPARASVADRVQRATFLQTLGRAQMGIGTVESFVGAEKALLEAYERSLALGAKSKFAQTSAEALVALYQAWQALAPSAEHAQALAKWQALVKR
jgi:tetratricopeptide (TPR) repeat protein